MGKEFELKYSATCAILEAVEREFGDFSPIRMESTYFDTADGQLSQRHITLRMRMENGHSVCTMKTPISAFARGEWELECADIEKAIPELCKLANQPQLKHLLQDGVRPVCGAQFLRKAKVVSLPDCTVELALDEGWLFAGANRAALCELEVELKDGSEEAATAFAQALAARYGMQTEPVSKFRRALALSKGV